MWRVSTLDWVFAWEKREKLQGHNKKPHSDLAVSKIRSNFAIANGKNVTLNEWILRLLQESGCSSVG